MRGRDLFTVLMGACVLAWGATSASGAPVSLRYGFRPGAVYRVTEQNHDVGKTITEVTMMGQVQRVETPTDQVSSGTWTARTAGRTGDGVVLAVEYGQHKGGQRWASEKVETQDVFSGSSASVVIDPTDGAVRFTVTPEGDETVELIYKGRFMWMPVLPAGGLKVGDTFTHDYVLSSGMFSIKATDEYYLAQVRGGFATFDVESKQLMVIRMDKGPGGTGPMGGMVMDDMKLAYKGEGTAVFDVGEGIFIEREGKMAYSNLESGKGATAGMAFATRMEGVMRYKWEMERR